MWEGYVLPKNVVFCIKLLDYFAIVVPPQLELLLAVLCGINWKFCATILTHYFFFSVDYL